MNRFRASVSERERYDPPRENRSRTFEPVLSNVLAPFSVQVVEGVFTIAVINFERRAIGNVEVILATNPDMEGEATAMYIQKKLKTINEKLKITRLAYGLPMGASVEYADYGTLGKALENRKSF